MTHRQNPEITAGRERAAKEKVAPLIKLVAIAMAVYHQNEGFFLKPKEFGSIKPTSWAILYELPFEFLIALFAYAVGQEDLIKEIGAKNIAVEEIQNISDDELEYAWDYRPTSKFSEADALAILIALRCTLNCLIDENKTIYDLVREVEAGNADATKIAVLYDPAVIYTPTIEKHLMQAIAERQNKFLKRVFSQARTPQKKLRRRNLRLAMQILGPKLVKELTPTERRAIFIEGLPLYEQSAGYKGLDNYVRSWLAKQSTF